MIEVKFVDVFTDMPIGRYRTDGNSSGEVFRDDVLLKLLQENDKVVLDLDGAYGYGGSFLEEAFGGIIRNGYYDEETLWSKLELKTNNEAYIEEIKLFVREAQERLNEKE